MNDLTNILALQDDKIININPDQAKEFYTEGYTICFQNLQPLSDAELIEIGAIDGGITDEASASRVLTASLYSVNDEEDSATFDITDDEKSVVLFDATGQVAMGQMLIDEIKTTPRSLEKR